MGITIGTCFVGPTAAVRFVADAADDPIREGHPSSMQTLSGQEVLAAVCGLLNWGGREVRFKRICTDSRQALPGDLFFAIVGEKFDGHDYIADAIAAGAVGVVCQRSHAEYKPGPATWAVEVPDTTVALGDLAHYYRRRLPAKVIAITGSLGKTTTKVMAHHMLSACTRTLASPKSFNNAIGLPLTLFGLTPAHDCAVVEMGTNAPGEIRRLADIARPDVAVITAVDSVHLEGFGDLESIAREKADVVSYMDDTGVLIINGDDARCVAIAERFPGTTLTFGLNEGCDVRGQDVERVAGGLRFVLSGEHVVTLERVRGLHNVYNALAAIAVYLNEGFGPHLAADRLWDVELPEMRLQAVDMGDRRCMCDCYNANPRSMAAALTELAQAHEEGDRAAVLGDMAELGPQSQAFHEELGRLVASHRLHTFVAIGPFMAHAADAAVAAGMPADRVFLFQSTEAATAGIDAVLPSSGLFLLKASRCMGLEAILRHLRGGPV